MIYFYSTRFQAIDEGKLEPDSEVLRELNKLAIKLDFLQNRKIKSGSEDCTLNDKLIVLLTMNNKISGSIFSVSSYFILTFKVNSRFIGHWQVEHDHQRTQQPKSKSADTNEAQREFLITYSCYCPIVVSLLLIVSRKRFCDLFLYI